MSVSCFMFLLFCSTLCQLGWLVITCNPFLSFFFFSFFLFQAGTAVVCGGQVAWQHANVDACRASQCVYVCVCVSGVGVVALLSALVGWAHLSLKMGDLWSRLPASRVGTFEIMKISVYCSLAQLNYKQCLVPWKVFVTADLRHRHVHVHTHTSAMDDGWHGCLFPPFAEQEDIVFFFIWGLFC